jgi:hypothetical protein
LGGAEGLVKINTNIPQSETQIPQISLADIKFNGCSYLKQMKNQTLHIPWNYNSLTIHICVKNEDIFQKNLLRYTISGRGKQTVESFDSELSLSSLSPGKYKIWVSSSTKDGEYTTPVPIINIVITPPWYKSSWFFSICTLLFILFTIKIALWVFHKKKKEMRDEMGGELTNAIKENPFTVILFDEIEKAHPKIMDIFLQILDDGRITSSRGDTVYLSESIIIFTSNLGIYEITSSNERIENVNNSMEYEDIHNKILSSIQNHFKFKLQRPEILNRIGENIVVFDFIREENARKIFTKMLNSIIINLQENHKIYLEFKNGSEKVLEMNCIVDLTMGGRGIGNHIESIFINPLSRKLFELGAKENDTIVIEEIYKDDYKWALKANKKSI